MTLTGVMVRALIAGLCVAAAAAIAALLTGDFSDTHARIVGTSLGFSFFTGLGAAGDSLRREAPVYVLGEGLDVSGELTCDWRDGDVW